MKKYLFIVLLVGAVFGQAVPDTLIMTTGQRFPGYYDSKDNTYTQFKHQNSTKIDRILNSVIQEIVLGDGTKIKKPIIDKKLPSVSSHLLQAGQHLENNVKYTIYGALLTPIGATLISSSIYNDETPLLGMVISGIGSYFSYVGFISISKAGKELKKSSKPMNVIENKTNKIELNSHPIAR